MNADEQYLISLLRAVLRGETAEKPPENVKMENVYSAAERHSVSGMAFYALEEIGAVSGELLTEWRQLRDKAIVKDITQQTELERICAALEQAGIRCLPLKGSIIKGFYPQSDMRTMSDIDILIDEENAAAVRDIMKSAGYSCEDFKHDHHDVYYMPPVMNIEIHRELLGEDGKDFLCVFPDPWELCEPAEGLRYKFRDNEFFAYILAHAIKHLDEGGTGIRTVMDIWVCLNSEMNIDCEMVMEMLQPSGRSDRARLLTELAAVWFGDKPHTAQTLALEQYILGSGTYGKMSNVISNDMERLGKKGYVFRLFFPRFSVMKRNYPVLKKAPFLLPLCWIARLVTKPFINRRQNTAKLRALMKK